MPLVRSGQLVLLAAQEEGPRSDPSQEMSEDGDEVQETAGGGRREADVDRCSPAGAVHTCGRREAATAADADVHSSNVHNIHCFHVRTDGVFFPMK